MRRPPPSQPEPPRQAPYAPADDATPELRNSQGQDMSRWSSPAPSIRFDAIGLIAPARQPVVDHGTYSLIVRPAAGEGMSVLPPGNGRADRAADIALNTADGSFPRHFTDQLELYRNFEFKPMRQHDYEATAERSETLVYVAARA